MPSHIRITASFIVAFCIVLICVGQIAYAQSAAEADVWFEVDALNTGLGDHGDGVALETPREAMSRFLDLTAEQDYEIAAHILNLNALEPARQAREGPELARMLAEVFERRVLLDWTDLPARPDGLNQELPESHPFSGRARRSILLAELTIDRRPIALRLNRVKPPDAPARWVISEETVENIPRMHEAFGPGWIESRVPPDFNKELAANLRIWELFVLPMLLIAAVGVFVLLKRLIRFVSGRVSIRWLNRASRKIDTPLAIALTALLLQNSVEAFLSFSSLISTILSPVLLAVLIFSFTYAVLNVIDTTLEIATDRYVGDMDSSQDSGRRHLYTNIYAARRYVLLLAFIISIVLLLLQLNLLDSFGMSLLASAGLVTVVLGIAGQTVLGNILASLQIAIAKPIRIGDSIQYEGRWAYVEAIYYTFITLRTWDSRRLIVPVKYFVSHPFENWTMTDAKSTREFTMELDLCAEPDELREIFQKVAAEDEDVMQEELLFVAVSGYSQTTQSISFYATANDPSTAWTMNVRLAEKMGDWVREYRPHWWPRFRVLEGAWPTEDVNDGRAGRHPIEK